MAVFKRICFGTHCFEIEVAYAFVQKAVGLMFRKKLPRDQGMLFVFGKEKIIPMWMFGMRFSIDIVWINADNKVVYIKKNAKPCRGLFCPAFSPREKAKYILEINSGVCEKMGIREGESVTLVH